MKQSIKIILLFICIFTILCLPSLSFLWTKTIAENEPPLNYIALGDSITLGTGLKKDESDFPTILYSYLKEETPNLNYKNYGKNGDTIKDITKKAKTKEVKNKLKNASVVTLTAGGNDILHLTAAAAKKYTGKDFRKSNSIPSFVKNETTSQLLLSYLKKERIQKELTIFLEEFESDFRTLLETIRKEAPNATIVVQTIYNPASGSEYESLAKCIDVVLPKTNDIIRKIVNEENEKTSNQENKILLLDTNHLFDQQAPIYVRVEEDDIHPTQAGHRLIANQIMILLENQRLSKDQKQLTKHASTTNIRSTNSDQYRKRALTFLSVGFILGLFILCLATIIGELYHSRKKIQ